jgi:hypothetical protein
MLGVFISMTAMLRSVFGGPADTPPQVEQPNPASPAKAETPAMRIDVFVDLPYGLDIKNPVIRITWRYVSGNRAIKYYLPDKDQIDAFFNMRVMYDGKDAEYKHPTLAMSTVLFNREEVLKPGSTLSLEVPLAGIYIIPDKWTVMEVEASKFGYSGISGKLTLKDEILEDPPDRPEKKE